LKAESGTHNGPKKLRQYPWSAELKPLIQASKATHYQWKQDKSDPEASMARTSAKRDLRSAQRVLVARQREEHQAKIMEANAYNSQEYYALVAKRRRHVEHRVTVNFNSSQNQLEGWQQYFEELATPTIRPEFDDAWLDSMSLQVLLLEALNSSSTPPALVNESDVAIHVKGLKNGKSADVYGITTEHVKHAAPVILQILTSLTNTALCTGKLLPQYKLGVLTPVPKSGKDPANPDSYRRITVCSILGKVLEKELAKRLREVVDPKQSDQQFGFTKGRSPTTCAFVITEAIAEAMDKGETLFLTFLDAKKAFDTVSHIPMLLSLQQHNVTGNLWKLMSNMYNGIRSQVKLQGQLSKPFLEQQGIRQGGLTSTDLYKVKANHLLDSINSHPLSYRIGTINVGAPTTADDTALISSSALGAKVLTGIAERDAQIHRYSFSTQKTKLMIINPKDKVPPAVRLNGELLSTTEQERHLGIERGVSDSVQLTIESRIKEARRALYRLAGAGLHGLNGVGPKVSTHMLNVYILPILTYGLEALTLDSKHYHLLECFYRNILRRLQHLPESTATPAVYTLLGSIPLEGQVHIRLLTFFGNVLRNPGTVEYEIIKRQLAIKDFSSNSWTVQIKTILAKYNLPSAHRLLLAPPAKTTWKSQVDDMVTTYWTEELQSQSKGMKTLDYVDTQNMQCGQVANVWQHSTDPLDAQMATIKARLLVQRYPLGYSHCAGTKKSNQCLLCGGKTETIEHFLLDCPKLGKTRYRQLRILESLCQEKHVNFPARGDGAVRFILTPAQFVNVNFVPLFEQATRRLIYRLHCARATMLGQK
jgi:hypothetical protein